MAGLAAFTPPGDRRMNRRVRVQRADWLSQRERGTVWASRLVYWLGTLLGRTPMRWLARWIALWYSFTSPSAARASRSWLTALGKPSVGFWDVYRHLLYFVQVTIDRMFLLKGKLERFHVTPNGLEHLLNCADQRRGAILLGAHLGSFEALRADGRRTDLPLNIVGHFENANMVNALFARLNPAMAARVIHIGRGSVDFIFDIRERLADGEFIGTMGDRVGLNEKSVVVEFLGRPARFPTGPFVLASILKCPIYLTFGLYREPNHYDLYCEPFAERIALSRPQRDVQLHQLVQRYAERLEHYCRLAPYNWFNFYDFWASAENEPASHVVNQPPTQPPSPRAAPSTSREASSAPAPQTQTLRAGGPRLATPGANQAVELPQQAGRESAAATHLAGGVRQLPKLSED